ncbi:hypothetical protein [Sphingomonas sp. Y38-1Y]|uniref:hypothetical protein n=1 Tax=Sphingomonas sp. Y38-1Y TaxID=3078265 RepID=UPI0028E1DC13|nr:hypothetical protein [Sphingomonas sp. Y38-1Y]
MTFSIKVANAIISMAMPTIRFAVSLFRFITSFAFRISGRPDGTLHEHRRMSLAAKRHLPGIQAAG